MNDNINEIEHDNTNTTNNTEPCTSQYGSEQYTGQYGAPYQSNQYSAPGSYGYSADARNVNSSPRKHPILKSIAFVLCLAIVGVGSVQGYRIYQDHNSSNGFSEFNQDKAKSIKDTPLRTTAASEDDDDTELPSLIELASRENAKSLPDIVDDIMPSVVGVSATFEYTVQSYDFFGWGTGSSTSKEAIGKGTGIILSDDGYIVTNAHCIYDDSSSYKAGEATDVSVRFSDNTDHKAKIIAYDTDSDLAVLKVDEKGLTPATFGDSDDLRVGELVVAVGNPLGFDLFGSVTSGIVSALNREVSINDKQMKLLQTDAAINAGNSGGPLLNSCGQVIGINSAKISSSYGSASVEGLCFAIPISDAKKIIDDLINYNYVTGRPKLGVSSVDVTEADSRRYGVPMGAYVINVEDGSAADLAGIMVRDIIIDIEGETISSTAQLNTVKNKYKAGDTISIKVNRNGEDKTFDVTLQEDTSNKAGKEKEFDPLDR